ncbi:MAG: MarR family transcriptional regulator [Bacteroidales bacterium]|nr:MarR family transcriptional regulator [Bacteroidales bacterium]
MYFTANSLSRHINTLAEEAFAFTGLTPSYAHLMLLLIEEPGLSQGEVSKRMNLKASTITRFIDKLDAKGYTIRTQEGRTVFIYPTEEGKKLKPIIKKALKKLFDMYCDFLGKDFAVKLTAEMYKANVALEK